MRLDGRTYVVTGANRGLGFQVSVALASGGAGVILAVRDVPAGEAAVTEIRARCPLANLRVVRLDLASLDSVRAVTDELRQDRLDGLVCNAAAIMVKAGRTPDGFETHWGVNHLGHFALAGGLVPALLRAPAPRVVMVTSLVARWGQVPKDPSGLAPGYRPSRAYAASKLANLIFGLELARRAESCGSSLLSVMAHPGYARSDEQHPSGGRIGKIFDRTRLISQSAKEGSRPLVRAAADQGLVSGSLVGPSGLLGTKGAPKVVPVFSRAASPSTGALLWRQAEEATGFSWPVLTMGGGPR